MTSSVCLAGPDGTIPFGTQVIAAASQRESKVIVIGAACEFVPEARLVDLLTGAYGIGAVVPGGDAANCTYARDVDATEAPCVAVTSSLLDTTAIDPHSNRLDHVVSAVLDRARSASKRIVSEPTWAIGSTSSPVVERGPARILFVTGAPQGFGGDRRVRGLWDLVLSLHLGVRHASVTVATALPARVDGHIASVRSAGIQVLEGPLEGRDPDDEDLLSFSHVIVSSPGAESMSRRWIDATQPQAAKILYLPWLGYREVDRLQAITPPDEMQGLEYVRAAAQDALVEKLAWADAAWCESRRDAQFVEGSFPGKPVAHIPRAVDVAPPGLTFDDRAGVVVVASDGHDVLACNEDAAVRVLSEILPQIRWRDANATCTVVADSPSPMLVRAVDTANACIVPTAASVSAIGSARLLLAGHTFGSGQPDTILDALALGTPVIATPNAAGDLDLGSLASFALFGNDADTAIRGCDLLRDYAAWSGFAEAARQFLQENHSSAARSSALSAALAPLGVEVGSEDQRWPRAPHRVSPRRPFKRVLVDLRPGTEPQREPFVGPEPVSERERYQLWTERFGPTAAALAAINRDLKSLEYQPKVSVLMPVYNTDADLLADAIDSVRAQLYPKWQLCIGNDGSDRPETLAALDAVGRHTSIEVVDLPRSGGISAATNAALAVADGDYVAFLDHDDLLKPHALAQVVRWLDRDPTLDIIYSDEDKVDAEGQLYDPHAKPDWSPDQLMNHNYINHLTVARRSLVLAVGGLRSEFDGSQDHDLLLRMTEVSDRIAHIPEPLYTWRAVAGSAAAEVLAKPKALEASRRAISAALVRRGYGGTVDSTALPGCFRARYELHGTPHVCIIIPTKDGYELLRRCVDSVLDRSTYENFDMLIIDNQSTDTRTLEYLANGPARVIRYPYRFNYARMMNMAARSVDCDALLFLNNDIEVITPEWIEALLEHAMRPEIGAVGARLYYPNGRVQHEGIMVGAWGGWAGNVDYGGYWNRGSLIRNTSAVTGACTMIRPTVYWEVGGNDERLRVAYNDVDLCLRIRQAGYEVVYTPFAELYHYESASRSGYEHPEDGPLFGIRWHPKETDDPYYNPMLSDTRPFAIRL